MDSFKNKTKEEWQEDWKEKLTPKQFHILREKGTEPAFSGTYTDNKENGMYHCVACDAPLFSSSTKFDSKSGWPSFTNPEVSSAIELKEDNTLGTSRTEVVCARCGGHLGHMFNDGPQEKGGKRYCINSTALDFNPTS